MLSISSYQLFKKIRPQLLKKFPNEATTLSFRIVEYFSGYTHTEILIDKPFTVTAQLESEVKGIIRKLLENKPIQYILGESYFYGRLFEVDSSTLIPRQETEELVHLVLNEIKNKKDLSILDIGTGTGCISITLQLESSLHRIEAIDICDKALEVAKKNAFRLKAKVKFSALDILKEFLTNTYDIIISNPPYILNSEKILMEKKVVNYEPNTALFVHDENPLIFYERIIMLATKNLNVNGKLYFEINEKFGSQIIALLKQYSFEQVVLYQDLNGKDRFISGLWKK